MNFILTLFKRLIILILNVSELKQPYFIISSKQKVKILLL